MCLYARWVQHDADTATEGRRWQVVAELSAHDTVAAMSTGDASPDASVVGALLLGWGLKYN